MFSVALAGGVPNAGDIPRAEPPRQLPSKAPATIKKQEKPAYVPPKSADQVTFIVERFTFTGNASFDSDTLSGLLADNQKHEADFASLNQAVKKITTFYRKKGYFLAQAYLPAQDIKQGVVEIAIIEGKLGILGLNGTEDFDAVFMKNMAAYQLAKGDAVSERNLVRNVTLLNSLPATRATAQLSPNANVGATDIEVTLEPLPRLQAYLGANTYGNRFTGREVVLAGVKVNNPAGLGDQLSLDLKRSRDNGQRGLNLSYITPIHASGTLFSADYSYVDYQLGGAFKALDALGKSQYFNLAIDQPIVRDAQKGLSARFGVSYKVVNDEVETVSFENQRNILAADFGLFGDWLNAAGDVSNQVGVSIRTGKVMFKDDFAQSVDEVGAKTQGGFIKYSVNATRLQYFENGISVALRADYQRASKNLDSVEKASIGGINRWRQFAELPSLADTSLTVGVELRKKMPANEVLSKLYLVDISPYSFLDVGRGKINQAPPASDNHVKSIHVGLGVDARLKNDWVFSLTGSHQNRDFSGADAENELRVWGQLLKYF